MKKFEQLRGVGQVFRFTLTQHFKNRTNLISLIIMLVLAMALVPVSSLIMGGGGASSEPEMPPEREMLFTAGEEIITVYLRDETGFELEGLLMPYLMRLRVMSSDEKITAEELDMIHDHAVIAHVFYEPSLGQYQIETYTSETSQVHRPDLNDLRWLLSDGLDKARAAAMTAEEQAWMDAVLHSYVSTADVDDVLGEAAEDVGVETSFAVEYVYAIILLMLIMMSSSFIIRSVVEEKSSKLIELMMISIHPLALLCGKILAMMTVVFGTMLALAAATGLSSYISGMFFDTSVIGTGLGEMGISLESLNLGMSTAIVVIVSLVLSYLTYSILSGIAGASCSSIADTDAATMSVVTNVLCGYIVSCVVAALPNRAVAIVTSLIPFVSAFCAPVHYVCGRIGLTILLLSWGIQAALVCLMAWISAKVYRDLIMHQGKRARWRDIWNMAKKARGGAADEA